MRYVQIRAGVVVAAIVAESAYAIPGVTFIQSDTAGVGDKYSGGVFTPPPGPDPTAVFAALKHAAVLQIDAEVDSIYAAAIGNRGPEYIDAEAQATAYVAAGYVGEVPPMVACWATAKGWTAAQAADDIIAAAASLNTAKQAIRAARLLRKEQVRNAADQAGIDSAMGAWSGFVAAIRQQLGL